MAECFYEGYIFSTCLDLKLHVFEHNLCVFWLRQNLSFTRPDVTNDVRHTSSTPQKMRRQKTVL